MMTKMNERVSELTNYLNVLANVHASGYKCHGEISEAIRELRYATDLSTDQSSADVYRSKILHACGEFYNDELGYVNEQIRSAYLSGRNATLYFERCSGVTTSVEALTELYEDIIYIENPNYGNFPESLGRVIFVKGSIDLPHGIRPKCVIRIRQIEKRDSYIDERTGKAFFAARVY